MGSKSDKIWKINISPYDQVLALTQHMINQAIDNLYVRLATGEEIDGAVKPKLGNCYADENNWVKDVNFGPPTVIVKADYSNFRSVRFRMRMKSGSIQLRRFIKVDEENGAIIAEKLNMAIQDWYVTVPVDVSFTEVNKETPRGKAIAERSAAKGKPDYSIYELLMDLSSMSFGDGIWEFGKWGNDDWMIGKDGKKDRPAGWQLDQPRRFTDLSKDFQDTMEFCMKKIAGNLMKSNLTSMGFVILAPDANRQATFEVNNTRYMTYPWTNPDTHNATESGLDGDGRLNYLLYLETVGKNTPPIESAKEAILDTRMGNWTDGRTPGIDAPSKFGTFVLSSRNFIDQFLIEKLSPINRMLSMDISNVTTSLEYKVVYIIWGVKANFGIGQGNVNDEQTTFKLKKQDYTWNDGWQPEAKEHLLPYHKCPGDGATVWKYEDIEWGTSAKHSYKNEGLAQVWMDGDTITFTRLYTIAGSNEIVYEGGQWTKFEYKVDPDFLTPNIKGKIIAQTKWKITFTMREVTDGGLQIDVYHEKPIPVFSGNYGEFEQIKPALENVYKTAGDNFEYYVHSIQNSLKGQEKFTLPASGVFYFKNPIMNSQGDLICGLEYNGNPKLGDPVNPTAEKTRDVTPVGELRNLPEKAIFSVKDKEVVPSAPKEESAPKKEGSAPKKEGSAPKKEEK